MMPLLYRSVRFALVVGYVAICCWPGVMWAASADKKIETAALPKPVPAVNINVTVNVHVSHDTTVDVKVEAPITPVVGSLQLPDFIQHLLSSFFKTVEAPATSSTPTKPSSGLPWLDAATKALGAGPKAPATPPASDGSPEKPAK